MQAAAAWLGRRASASSCVAGRVFADVPHAGRWLAAVPQCGLASTESSKRAVSYQPSATAGWKPVPQVHCSRAVARHATHLHCGATPAERACLVPGQRSSTRGSDDVRELRPALRWSVGRGEGSGFRVQGSAFVGLALFPSESSGARCWRGLRPPHLPWPVLPASGSDVASFTRRSGHVPPAALVVPDAAGRRPGRQGGPGHCVSTLSIRHVGTKARRHEGVGGSWWVLREIGG